MGLISVSRPSPQPKSFQSTASVAGDGHVHPPRVGRVDDDLRDPVRVAQPGEPPGLPVVGGLVQAGARVGGAAAARTRLAGARPERAVRPAGERADGLGEAFRPGALERLAAVVAAPHAAGGGGHPQGAVIVDGDVLEPAAYRGRPLAAPVRAPYGGGVRVLRTEPLRLGAGALLRPRFDDAVTGQPLDEHGVAGFVTDGGDGTALGLGRGVAGCADGRGARARARRDHGGHGEQYNGSPGQHVSSSSSDTGPTEVTEKDDHLARLTTSFASGGAPDVFLINYREYARFVARGALRPAGPLLTRQGVRAGDYYPQPMRAFTYRGALQCMPQNVSSLVVYYNGRLFSEAGIDPPEAGWTWEDFARTARELTRGDVHGVGIEPSLIRAAPFVWANGGEITGSPDAPTRLTLDTPPAREALEFLLGLRDAGPGKEELAAQDLETRFAAGKLGMLLSPRRETPMMREVKGLEFDVAPLPRGPSAAGILRSDGYCVARTWENTAAAARFIAFAVARQGQTLTRARRPYSALTDVGGQVRRVPRPGAGARALPGLPGRRARHPGHAGASALAGGRGGGGGGADPGLP
ncbi:MAG: extracellular solute-binding protein [Streptosporangiales bacterium]|nr:extracellular solute-binding protein [Streptosporangiales bacterium]